MEEIIERGVNIARELPHKMVYAGFSLGVMPGQKLAMTCEGAQGALFFGSCIPASMLGSSWPVNLPVQIHAKDADSTELLLQRVHDFLQRLDE